MSTAVSIIVSADLLSIPLSGQRLLDALLLSRLEVERVLLYLFDNVLRLNLALKTAKGILQRLSLLKPDFSHSTDTPLLFKVLCFSQLAEINEFLNQCQGPIGVFSAAFAVRNDRKAPQVAFHVQPMCGQN